MLAPCAIDVTGNPLPDKTLEYVANGYRRHFIWRYWSIQNTTMIRLAKVRPEQGLLKTAKSIWDCFANIRPVKAYEATH